MAPPKDFPTWLKKVANTLTWDWPHQLYLYEALDAVTRGELRRLMIFMPPRHSKSETVTVHYTAFRILLDPTLNVIMASYNQKLANRFSRRAMRIAAHSGCMIRKDRHAAEEWETEKGGGVRAVGAGAGVTGFGAGLVIIDDPVKSRAHAESLTIRESTWNWFNDDVYTRLEPKGSVILIQTRWHEDDLAGRILEHDSTNEWRVIKLAALAIDADPLGREEGEALCPARFDREALLEIKTQIGSHSFSALYQQDPLPGDSCLFRREWFSRIVDAAPEGIRWVRGYDLAVSIKETADHTASFRVGLAENGDIFIADGFRARVEFPDQRRFIRARLLDEGDTTHYVESALHGQALVQDLLADPELVNRSIRSVRVKGDKGTRAAPWIARAEAGHVVLVRGPWIDDFLDEVCRFPLGRHDDQVDAVSLAMAALGVGRKGAYAF